MATFIVLVYGQYFLQTALTAAAPINDRNFWRNGNKYSCVNRPTSNAVMQSVMRQMFHLVEETVPFALCDDGTTFSEKKDLVEKLLSSDRL